MERKKSKTLTILALGLIFMIALTVLAFQVLFWLQSDLSVDIVSGSNEDCNEVVFSVQNTAVLSSLLTPSILWTLAAGVVFVMPVKDFAIKKLRENNVKIPVFLRMTLVIAFFVMCVIKLAASSFNPFIYTQF